MLATGSLLRIKMTMKADIIFALAAFAIILFVAVYIVAYYKAKKYCEYYHYNFKKFWIDELTKGVDTTNPYEMEQYKIKED